MIKYPYGKIFFILLSIFVIAPFVVISFFNHPSADDFCFSFRAIQLGFWEAQAHWYNGWTGRYFSSALLSVGPVVNKSILQYKIFPIFVFILLLVAFYTLFKHIVSRIPAKYAVFGASMMLLLYLAGAPNISEGFYWMSGYVTYQYGNILFIFLLAFLVKFYNVQEKSRRILYFILCSLFIVFVVGCNETIMIILTSLLFLINVYIVGINKKLNKGFVVFFVIAVIASLVVILAPGNEVRMENHVSRGGNLFYSLYMSVFEMLSNLFIWVSKGPLLLFSIFFIPIAAKIHEKYSEEFKNIYIHPLLGIISLGFLIFISHFPAFWSLGGPPPTRTLNVIYLIFLLGWFYNIYLFVVYSLKSSININLQIPRYVVYFSYFLIFYSVIDEGNVRKVYADLLKGRAYKYDQEMKEREELISTSNDQLLNLPPLSSPPETIFFEDITNDTEHWKNKCFFRYFQKKAVVIED